jgi:hypothetical protein
VRRQPGREEAGVIAELRVDETAKQKIFFVIEINKENVKPGTIVIISAIYFAEPRLSLSITIMGTN